MVKSSLLSAISWYQRRGGSKQLFNLECNFEPTCSEYTRQAIEKYGAYRGVKLGLKRIHRCSDPDCVNKIHDPLT